MMNCTCLIVGRRFAQTTICHEIAFQDCTWCVRLSLSMSVGAMVIEHKRVICDWNPDESYTTCDGTEYLLLKKGDLLIVFPDKAEDGWSC